MSNITPFMNEKQLSAVASIASMSQCIEAIQGLIDSSWNFDYPIGNGWTITGSPNDFTIAFNQNFSASGTIIPGVPSYTITPAVDVPPVMAPATPGWGTTNACSAWGGKCTTSVPGTPAYTITPGYTVPAVMSPAIPAVTGGYSSDVVVNVDVKGVSSALTPLLESITFVDASDPTESETTQACTYNLNSEISGSQIKVSGSAAVNNIVVTISGVSTDLGSISSGAITLSPVPNIPIQFDIIMDVPPYNSAPAEFAATDTTLAYTPIPYTSGMFVSDLAISTGITPVADFICSDLLDPLTATWNALVCPLFSAVNASCPASPTQTLSDYITTNAVLAQQEINSTVQAELNSILSSMLSTIQPYSLAVITTGWNVTAYPITGEDES
jgi:hypothetical protein